jgi:hypothetical protein
MIPAQVIGPQMARNIELEAYATIGCTAVSFYDYDCRFYDYVVMIDRFCSGIYFSTLPRIIGRSASMGFSSFHVSSTVSQGRRFV